jgi:MoxR-like ATPase
MATLENMLTVALCTPMDDPHDENCRQGAPICLWGPPGIGKSGRVEQAGSAIGLGVSTLYLSTLQPEDLSGVPMPDGKGGAINMVTLPQIQECLAAKRRILFLDELTTARPAVQGAGLGVVYTRKVGGRS